LVISFGQRLKDSFSAKGQLCVGLDPSAEQLQKWGIDYSATGAEKFCNLIIHACENRVGILKPQVSFFEQFGPEGFVSLQRILDRANNEGFLVIADAKRGDIGSTMDGYAKAWIESEAPFRADAITVSPYLGPDSLTSFCSIATANQKGVFVLAATSNPEARASQSASVEGGESVAGNVVSFASSVNQEGFGSVGVVLGAQTDLPGMGIEITDLASIPILAPGFGAQGAKLTDATELFGPIASNVIYSVSRSVAGDNLVGLQDRVQSAVDELEIGLSR
jgi:orotidine-5'-phosphate decarboxylase